jgi:hypothetical protein
MQYNKIEEAIKSLTDQGIRIKDIIDYSLEELSGQIAALSEKMADLAVEDKSIISNKEKLTNLIIDFIGFHQTAILLFEDDTAITIEYMDSSVDENGIVSGGINVIHYDSNYNKIINKFKHYFSSERIGINKAIDYFIEYSIKLNKES